VYRAVIFDLGGVVFPSPFAAFDAYESRVGLPAGSVRGVIRTSSETGAWAAHERGAITHAQFLAALSDEARAVGVELDAAALMASLGGERGNRAASGSSNGDESGAVPEMVTAIQGLRRAGLRTAALTNNWTTSDGASALAGLEALGLFDAIVESSKVGLRKPDPRIYEMALDRLEVTAAEAVFLDDLGINLKPARAMGMATIKVVSPEQAIGELEQLLGLELLA
jgi:putative hydrolase of the HAD superfamily